MGADLGLGFSEMLCFSQLRDVGLCLCKTDPVGALTGLINGLKNCF